MNGQLREDVNTSGYLSNDSTDNNGSNIRVVIANDHNLLQGNSTVDGSNNKITPHYSSASSASPVSPSASPSPSPPPVSTDAMIHGSQQQHHHPNTSNNNNQIVYDDDDYSGNCIDREYTGVFEGPEKTLEVMFRKVNTPGEVERQPLATPLTDERVGLRRLSRTDLDRLCARARCTILSCVSNQHLDAYVLSESSLFIYPYMVVLKTCGTTTLLRCIAILIDLGKSVGLEIDWVGYSRKNFNYPGDQEFPHQSFHQELEYLYSHRNLCQRLDGNGYTLGPVTSDHWFVFVADQTVRSKSSDIDTDRVLNIMMFDIDEECAKVFYYNTYDKHDNESKDDERKRISKEMTKNAGIDALCPGSIIDPCAFEPCGYSMNAILFRSYCTMHITPESGSSYASFETNQRVSSYRALINNVVRTFKPKRFVMTLMADEGGLKHIKDNPLSDNNANKKELDNNRIVVPITTVTNTTAANTTKSLTNIDGGSCENTPQVSIINNNRSDINNAADGTTPTKITKPQSKEKFFTYKRSSLASIKVEEDCCCMMGNFVLEKPSKSKSSSNNSDDAAEAINIRSSKLRGMSVS